MPRKNYVNGCWYYKQVQENEWKAFPYEVNKIIEKYYLKNASYEGEFDLWANFFPFITDIYKMTAARKHVSKISFPAGELNLKEPRIDFQIQRRVEFKVNPIRAQIDNKCNVPSLPLSPNPFYRVEYREGDAPFTIKEKTMMQISATIREKPDWERKYKDPQIVNKWKAEIFEQISDEADDDMFKYVIDELAYYESLQKGTAKPSSVDGVWQSDSAVPEELRQELLREVAKLENVPDHQKDWHPGSNNQVLDLVHPSLFCYVAGISRQIPLSLAFSGSQPFKYIGGGEIAPTKFLLTPEIQQLQFEINKETRELEEILSGTRLYKQIFSQNTDPSRIGNANPKISDAEVAEKIVLIKAKTSTLSEEVANRKINASEKFQWLPSDVQVDGEGKAKLLSYINNLDPRSNSPLYRVLEKILTTFLPMYESVLTDLNNPRERRFKPDPFSWYLDFDDFKELRKNKNTIDKLGMIIPEDMADDELYEEYEQYRAVELPPLPAFVAPNRPTTSVDLKGRRLQVIFKLANIILTPEKPEYAGEEWQVEGMQNEQIVSSAIYYYDSENITESRLHFRMKIAAPEYEEGDGDGVSEVYGLNNLDALLQDLGSIITKSGRSITFPNFYQHYVAPFKLQDASKPGHRKILVFFLVDPAVYVTSTAQVPPQQPSWRQETINKYRPIGSLPSLIQETIFDNAATITRKDAETYREELMKERKFFVSKNNNYKELFIVN